MINSYDVAIVGSGVLGSALSAEARSQGLDVVCIGPDSPSESLVAGRFFRLNTWARPDQHPLLSRVLRRGERFLPAEALSHAAAQVLRDSGVVRVFSRVREIQTASTGVQLKAGRSIIRARAAVLALGWGAPKVELARPEPLRRALKRGEHAFDFSTALQRLATRSLRQATLAVVGGGPSALSFLEACVGLSPHSGLELTKSQRVIWFDGKTPIAAPPGVKKMFEVRYAPLFARLKRTDQVQRCSERISAVHRRAGRWTLIEASGKAHDADGVVWCAGLHAPLELLGAMHRPLVHDGAKLALQRVTRGRTVPVFQVGPALDQLGLADWDTGPYAEWFEKGRRLLRLLGGT
ncbi:MAG: FAD-dependent oxidoreductase [Archangium sp.]|nr:FAD-dependent oxidoreductase [Archangium sp.]MDP3158116.1 FAD-dependent oxidoreductase [Archangium sp.]MDP3570477.1 FAD-dependent oxidoreductase [Archangium sp.]